MSRKQVRKMLISEGLYYAIITLVLVLSAGNLIAYGIFKLFQQQVSFAVFTYPLIPGGQHYSGDNDNLLYNAGGCIALLVEKQ